jgi:hypothetical protein
MHPFLQIRYRPGKVTSAPAADLKRITAYTPRIWSGSGVKAGACENFLIEIPAMFKESFQPF